MSGALRWLLAGLAVVAGVVMWVRWKAADAPCRERIFDGSTFTVCEFQPERDEIALLWADAKGQALRDFSALEARGGVDSKRVLFAMNAGMFDTSGAPIGLFVSNKVETHPINTKTGTGNFYLLPNGVFYIDDQMKLHIETTDRYLSPPLKAPVLATQSGPMLVIDGQMHAAFQPDGDSRNVRNGVGVAAGNRAFFAISEEPVSFGKLARLFRDELKCNDALYLDGAVSSLWVPAFYRRDDAHALGPMIVVSRRKSSRPTFAAF